VGCVGVWGCGGVGVRVCGCVGVWVCECVGVWGCAFQDLRADMGTSKTFDTTR
jgi:hypothetical protein